MDEESKKDLQIGLFSIIMVLGVIGNSLVIYIYSHTSRKRFLKFERMILILAVVDLLASTINPLYYIYQIKTNYQKWMFGEAGCKILPALGPIFSAISLGLILLMAIDRDRAVCTPFKQQFSLSAIYKGLFVTVVLSVATNVPYIHYLEVHKISDEITRCSVTRSAGNTFPRFFVTINILSDICFLLIFTTTTVRIYMKLTNQHILAFPKTKDFRSRETKRILRTILAMGVCFIVLIYPKDIFQTSYYISVLHPPVLRIKDHYFINALLKVLHTSNSVVNVFLYSCLNRTFRRDVVGIVMRIEYIRRLSGYTSSTDTSFHSKNNNTNNSRRQSELNQSKRLEVLRRISVQQPKLSIKPETVQSNLPLEPVSEQVIEEKPNEMATSYGVRSAHHRLHVGERTGDEPCFGDITIINENTNIPRENENGSETTPILR